MTARRVPDDPDSWRDDAACLEHPAEMFTGPHQPGDSQRAIDICNTCPVKQPCLDAALLIGAYADLGIWGGTTPSERRRIRRQRPARRAEPDVRHRVPATTAPVHSPSMSDGKLELHQDQRGDHVDRTGRVIVFEIHGDPPYMLMIDGQPRARTTTVDDAAGLAARFIAAATAGPARTDRHLPALPDARHTAAAAHRR